MPIFKLDQRLMDDCHLIAESDYSAILLMDNSLFRWFIFVPFTHETELYKLEPELHVPVYASIDLLSAFIADCFRTDKLNVAAIGNLVKQMHIHVVGRYKSDPCWPGVVWGTKQRKAYSVAEVTAIKTQLQSVLPAEYSVVK